MTHIEEYILELFVLGAPEVETRRPEILAHLEECHGCRSLVGEIQTFYSQLDHEFDAQAKAPNQEPENFLPRTRDRGLALKKRREELEKLFETRPRPPVMFFKRAGYVIRRHPVIAGAGSVVSVGLLAAALMVGAKDLFKDRNPAYTIYKSDYIEVFNKENTPIWNLPAVSLDEIRNEESNTGVSYTQIADMDGNGLNEIVTVLDVCGETTSGIWKLKIFDGPDNLRLQRDFTTEFHFRNRLYPDNFAAKSFVIRKMQQGAEIYCLAENQFSPSYLARMDPSGKILGEYWHFGHLRYLYEADLFHAGRQQLIVSGTNDLDDTAHNEFGVIIVLDPEKITGKTTSTAVTGFGLQKSGAELYYIRLPRVDMNYAYNDRLFASLIKQLGNGLLEVNISNKLDSSADDYIWFKILFTPDMKAISARSANVTDEHHDELAAAGKVTGRIDSLYLQHLQNSIRYWDGSGWQNHAVMVNH